MHVEFYFPFYYSRRWQKICFISVSRSSNFYSLLQARHYTPTQSQIHLDGDLHQRGNRSSEEPGERLLSAGVAGALRGHATPA